MGTYKRTYSFSKETPGTVVYKEDELPGEPVIIKTIYIQKFAAVSLGKHISLVVTGEAKQEGAEA